MLEGASSPSRLFQPVWSRDWELLVSFKVQGTNGDLFGDGLAIWYAQEPSQLGDVFGSKDFFRGLAIFLDTYSNHNGPHSVCLFVFPNSLNPQIAPRALFEPGDGQFDSRTCFVLLPYIHI